MSCEIFCGIGWVIVWLLMFDWVIFKLLYRWAGQLMNKYRQWYMACTKLRRLKKGSVTFSTMFFNANLMTFQFEDSFINFLILEIHFENANWGIRRDFFGKNTICRFEKKDPFDMDRKMNYYCWTTKNFWNSAFELCN